MESVPKYISSGGRSISPSLSIQKAVACSAGILQSLKRTYLQGFISKNKGFICKDQGFIYRNEGLNIEWALLSDKNIRRARRFSTPEKGENFRSCWRGGVFLGGIVAAPPVLTWRSLPDTRTNRLPHGAKRRLPTPERRTPRGGQPEQKHSINPNLFTV